MPPRASIATERICTDCKELKPVSEFHGKGTAWDGTPKYQSYCRKCANGRRAARQVPWADNPALQAGVRRYQAKNRELLAARASARRASDPVRLAQIEADRHLLRKYGLTMKDWWLMLEEQDYKCPGCLRYLHPDVGKVCVDHDHETGQNRSLLCDDCNKGLESCKDDPETLERLAAYIRRHRDGNSAFQHSA